MAAKQNGIDARSALGVAGVLLWLFMFGVVEYSHDMVVRSGSGNTPWSTVYEVAAGYILGFVAAHSAWVIWKLAQGPVPEILSESAWARGLLAVALLAVLASALAGLVMHNMGGLTPTYDIAFVIAILVVIFGVIPLYRRWRS